MCSDHLQALGSWHHFESRNVRNLSLPSQGNDSALCDRDYSDMVSYSGTGTACGDHSIRNSSSCPYGCVFLPYLKWIVEAVVFSFLLEKFHSIIGEKKILLVWVLDEASNLKIKLLLVTLKITCWAREPRKYSQGRSQGLSGLRHFVMYLAEIGHANITAQQSWNRKKVQLHTFKLVYISITQNNGFHYDMVIHVYKAFYSNLLLHALRMPLLSPC